jgi:hypothetical protein
MDTTLLSSIIGLLGVLLGVCISEYLRRQSRVEKLSETFFSKKIDVYENVSDQFQLLTQLFYKISPTEEKGKNLFDEFYIKTLPFVDYLESKNLFIDENLSVHLILTLIKAGEFLEGINQIDEIDVVNEFKESKLLIRKSLGVNQIEKDLLKVSKSTLSSNNIGQFKKIKTDTLRMRK